MRNHSTSKLRLMPAVAFTTALCLVTSAASAQSRKSFTRKATATAQFFNAPAVPTPKIAARPQAETSTEPLLGVVSLNKQRITLWQGNRVVAEAPISSGQDGYRTPKGVFSIIQKNRYHESNIYSGAPMPFMQRLTWSGIALHAGNLPGYPASHGCVRLPESFASNLFGMTRLGMRVIVADHQTAPVGIAHQNLPVPRLQSAPDAISVAAPSPAITGLTAASLNNALFVSTAQAAHPSSNLAPQGPTRLLNPIEFARFEQKQIANQYADAVETANRHHELAALAAAIHRQSLDDVSRIAEELKQLNAAVNVAQKRLATARDDEERVQFEATHYMVEERAAETRAELEHARAYEAETADEAMQTALATKVAAAQRDEAEYRARVAVRAAEPISIFVSRKTRRVYVRQGFEPILEASIDIAEDNAVIGTHVFTATAPLDAGRAMSWHTITVPEVGGASTASAADAIARVTLPAEIRHIVAGKLWTGASLIISDHAPSLETGKGTDFVILTQ